MSAPAVQKLPLPLQIEVVGSVLNQCTMKDGSLANNAVVHLSPEQVRGLQTVHATLTLFSGHEAAIRRAIFGRRE